MENQSNTIVLLTPDAAMQQAKSAYQIVKMMSEQVLVKGVDYGIIPGTDKPTLYKPGAEKLCRAFNYNPVFETVGKVEQWDDESAMFHYEIRCHLIRIDDSREVATGLGSCNSKESKYRWRWLFDNQAKALGLDLTTLVKKSITSQKNGKSYTQYRVPNDDIFSLVNTIEKMACKRSLIAAVLIGVGASEFFTQDIEDLRDFAGDIVEGDFVEVSQLSPATKAQPVEPPKVDVETGEITGDMTASAKDWDAFWKTWTAAGYKPSDVKSLKSILGYESVGGQDPIALLKKLNEYTVAMQTTPPAEPKSNGHVASADPADEPKNVQTLGKAIDAAVQPKLMETATPGAHKQMPAKGRGYNPYSKTEGGEK